MAAETTIFKPFAVRLPKQNGDDCNVGNDQAHPGKCQDRFHHAGVKSLTFMAAVVLPFSPITTRSLLIWMTS